MQYRILFIQGCLLYKFQFAKTNEHVTFAGTESTNIGVSKVVKVYEFGTFMY
jgi:hypothetical protein